MSSVMARTEASSDEERSPSVMGFVDEIIMKLDQASSICNVICYHSDIDPSINNSVRVAGDLIEESQKAFKELFEAFIKKHL